CAGGYSGRWISWSFALW
nr:immunoglobulin heavy chain junction region [Macaca mulatta]